jgi:hypothetical protein
MGTVRVGRMFPISFVKEASSGVSSALLVGRAIVASIATVISLFCDPVSAKEGRIMRASDMIRLTGVNTHMTYNDGAYANSENVLKDLQFLGVSHIRDSLPGADSQPALQGRDALRRLVHQGVKLNIFFPSGWNATSIAWLRSLEAAAPGAIVSVEGYNEINNFPPKFEGLSGPAAAKAGQKALYDAIKSDPVLKHVPVLDMTGFEMIKDPTFTYGTTLDDYADVLNVHAYAQNGAPPGIWINPERPAIYKGLKAELPKTITEFGYSSRPESNWGFIGVDERTQAKGILNGLFDAARSGYDRVYLYELLDEKPDPELKDLGFHFGLFTFANEPKLAARAIRNLTQVLGSAAGADKERTDPLPSNTSIDVKIDGPDDNMPVFWIVLLRENGSPIVALWRETPFWDRANGRPLEAPSIPAKVSFGKACGSIRTYDLFQSSDPKSVSAGSSLTVGVVDRVQLVECAS